VYAPSFWPYVNVAEKSQPYPDVKNWAYNVADGYDSRATLNRQALYGGALVAVAGASALVGLAAFAPGSSAIIGIPIGTTFLSGAMAIYNNEQKAVIYGSASQTIRDVLIQSDCRMVKSCPTANQSCVSNLEAVCLHAEVSEVMRKVNDHITLVDPKNVADMLKAVASSIAAKEAVVARRQKLTADADAALKNAKDSMVNELKQANAEADKALKTAQEDLKTAQEQNTVQNLSAAANDFNDLKVVPQLCETPVACQLRQ
jgi:hypothetical protein